MVDVSATLPGGLVLAAVAHEEEVLPDARLVGDERLAREVGRVLEAGHADGLEPLLHDRLDARDVLEARNGLVIEDATALTTTREPDQGDEVARGEERRQLVAQLLRDLGQLSAHGAAAVGDHHVVGGRRRCGLLRALAEDERVQGELVVDANDGDHECSLRLERFSIA